MSEQPQPRHHRRWQMDKQESKERDLLLREHNEKWRAQREKLQDECAAEGHTDQGVPGNRSNCSWVCWHCRANIGQRPFYADAIGVGGVG